MSTFKDETKCERQPKQMNLIRNWELELELESESGVAEESRNIWSSLFFPFKKFGFPAEDTRRSDTRGGDKHEKRAKIGSNSEQNKKFNCK